MRNFFLRLQAKSLLALLKSQKKTIVLAESCTSGLIASTIGSISGSSEVFWGSIVSYSNDAKMKVLKVTEKTLLESGAVSKATVLEMATGALTLSDADFALSVSGIAGPMGGTKEKPVGTVWICLCEKGREIEAECYIFSGKRLTIQAKTCKTAFKMLKNRLEHKNNFIY